MLFLRVVVDVDVGAGGRLLPRAGAAWRPEPARREGSLHRQLASLATASDTQIAAFASTHGLLRRRGSELLGNTRARSAGVLAAIGQESMDDSARLQRWYDAGAIGGPPAGSEDTQAIVELYAALPVAILDAFDAYMEGRETDSIRDPLEFFGVVLPVTAAASHATNGYRTTPARIRGMDPSRVRRAFRINEWVSRVIGALDEAPESLASVGGMEAFFRQMVLVAPELLGPPQRTEDDNEAPFLEEFAGETVDDWRSSAAELSSLVQSLDLIRQALRPTGLSASWKRQILDLYRDLADYEAPGALTSSEIADRTRPLLAAIIQDQLQTLGAWPVRPRTLAGVYVRSLAAACAEARASSLPIGCATPGCTGAIPPTRNRRYCESCQRARRRAAVRRSRARSPVTGFSRENEPTDAPGLEAS